MAKSPDQIVADIDRQQNEEDLKNLDKYVVQPIKSTAKSIYEGFVGTPEPNRMGQENLDKAARSGSGLAKALGGKAMKKGGTVRGHGCEVRGKTKGKMVTMCGGGYAKGKK
jgi:hypothetical protein